MTFEAWLSEVRVLFTLEGVDLPEESALYRFYQKGMTPMDVLLVVVYG